jgi:hypothetical protein
MPALNVLPTLGHAAGIPGCKSSAAVMRSSSVESACAAAQLIEIQALSHFREDSQTSIRRSPILDAEQRKAIAMEDCFELGFRDTRQLGALGKVIHPPERVHGFLWRGNGQIGAKEQLFGRSPLTRQPKGIVVRPRPVELRRDVGVNMRVFADDRDAIDLPGMTHVRQDHAQVRECHGHAIDVSGVGEVEVRELVRRGPLMEQDR